MAVVVRRVRPVTEVDPEMEELAKIVRAAQLYADGKSQQAIAEEFTVSISTVARWLARAGRQEILKTIVIPPRITVLEQKLGAILGPKGVRSVSVVPNGAGKDIDNLRNVANLGLEGARQLIHCIQACIDRGTSQRAIRIALSCGTTVTTVIENLIDMLYNRQVVEGRPLTQKLEIYPTVLFGDSTLDPIYPHTIVTYFAMLARNAGLTVSGTSEALISANALQLPTGFYRRKPEERNKYKQQWGLDEFVTDIKKADIFVLGGGNLTAESYGEISNQLAIEDHVRDLLGDEKIVQVLYTPLKQNGLPDDEISKKIVGLTVHDARDIARDPTKRVMLVAGGHEKFRSLQRALEFPCYNALVTDVGVAEEAIRLDARRM